MYICLDGYVIDLLSDVGDTLGTCNVNVGDIVRQKRYLS